MMDIKTEKGQKTLEDEHRAAHLFEHHHPTHKYVMTPKDLPVELDAVIVRDGYLQAVVETKCRYDMTLDELRYARDFKWLISTSKIVAGESVVSAGRSLLWVFVLSSRWCFVISIAD